MQSLKPITIAPKEVPMRGLPRRTLFSPVNDENKKRKRSTSPDQDAENRGGKLRRFDSPTRMTKSQSFSIAPSSSSSAIDNRLKFNMLYRTQSEILTHSSEITGSLGYKEAMTNVVKQVKFIKLISTSYIAQLDNFFFIENPLGCFNCANFKADLK